MEVTVGIEKLKRLVECAICLETLSNPKSLQCNHSFCKACLDGLLDFEEDGSANIKCPKGCPHSTMISNTQTSNDLGVDSIVKDLLDTIFEAETCFTTKGKCDLCNKTIAKYCSFCKIFLCGSCKDPHDDIVGSFQSVRYSERNEEISLFCDEHATEIKSLCCDRYACVYCYNRNHPGHEHKTLEEIAETLRKELMDDLDTRKCICSISKDIQKKMIVAEKELEVVLNKKILDCMTDYANFLKAEAGNIKKSYLSNIKQHLKNLQELDSVEFFEHCLPKKNVEILLNQDEIKMRLGKKTVPQVTLSLTDTNFKDEHPLGILKQEIGADVCPINNNSFTSEISLVSMAQNPTQVKNLIDLLLEYSRSSQPENASHDKEPTNEIEPFLGEGIMSLKIDITKKEEYIYEYNNNNYIKSVPIVLKDLEWFAELHVDEEDIGVYLTCASNVQQSKVLCGCSFQFSLQSCKKCLVRTAFDVYEPGSDGRSWGYEGFVSWQDITNEENGYIKDNAIMLETKIQVDIPSNVHWDSKKQTGYVGIKRQKHSCYTNSILQLLFSLVKIRKSVFAIKVESKDCAENLETCIRYLFFNDHYEKDESHELGLYLKRTFLELDNSYEVVSAKDFHNALHCEKTCVLSDNHVFSFQECFCSIRLVVEEGESLDNSFARFITEFSSQDPNCKKPCKGDLIITMMLQSPPPILLLHIKDMTNCVHDDDDDKGFFPKELNLSKYLAEEAKLTNSDALYSLYSVLIYFNNHYSVYINCKGDGKWYKFDDHLVSRVSEDEATLKNFHKNVHLLTYIQTSELGSILGKGSGNENCDQSEI